MRRAKSAATPSGRRPVAILKTLEPQLLAAPDACAFTAALRAGAARCHDRDALMTLAFSGIGALPGARLDKLRATAEQEVHAEREDATFRRGVRPSMQVLQRSSV